MKTVTFRILFFIAVSIGLSIFLANMLVEKSSARMFYSSLDSNCKSRTDAENRNIRDLCVDANYAMSEESPITEGKIAFVKFMYYSSSCIAILLIFFVMYIERKSSLIISTDVTIDKTESVSENIERYKNAQQEVEHEHLSLKYNQARLSKIYTAFQFRKR